jgi:hypothetical protein
MQKRPASCIACYSVFATAEVILEQVGCIEEDIIHDQAKRKFDDALSLKRQEPEASYQYPSRR